MENALPDFLPSDPAMLLSYVNMRLRDDYPEGLDSMCAALDIPRYALVSALAEAGFEYSPDNNKFW